MKKNVWHDFTYWKKNSEIIRVMKLVSFLLLAGFLEVSANVYSPPFAMKDASLTMGSMPITSNGEQKKKVSGTLSDEKGLPIPGVTVTIEGTTRGVISDLDGNYGIDAVTGNTLVFSFVGFTTQKVKVGTQKINNIVLSEEFL
mgnify:CR=1 FL=1